MTSLRYEKSSLKVSDNSNYLNNDCENNVKLFFLVLVHQSPKATLIHFLFFLMKILRSTFTHKCDHKHKQIKNMVLCENITKHL